MSYLAKGQKCGIRAYIIEIGLIKSEIKSKRQTLKISLVDMKNFHLTSKNYAEEFLNVQLKSITNARFKREN